jgi:acetyl esterase
MSDDGPLWPDSLTTRQRLEGRMVRLLSGLPGSWLLKVIGETPIMHESQVLDPHTQFILAARRRRPSLLLTEPNPIEARQRFRREIQAVAIGSGARPTRVQSVRHLTIDGGDVPLPARLYSPLSSDASVAKPLLVYLHGGGFVLGDLESHDEPCRLLCHHGDMHVLHVAYRLAPEHPFPAAADDADHALAWAQEHAAHLGADERKVCIGGDSAGGTLATAAALRAAERGRAPAAQLLMYPATDHTPGISSRERFADGFLLTAADMTAFTTLYFGSSTPPTEDLRACPLRAPDLSRAPATLITTAGFDPLRGEGDAYADALRRAGVMVHVRCMTGLVHGYLHMTTVSPAAHSAVTETARLFRSLLAERHHTAH